VVRVVDGDTAVFSVGGRQEKVRFIGVDTPESTTQHEPYGEEASNYTKRVLEPGRRVYLETDAELRDRYGRMLAYVWLEAPTDRGDASLREKQFNARLLLHGYAQQMTIQPNSKYADSYTVYAREAREQNRGLWALPLGSSSSVAPSKPAASTSGRYIGSQRSNKFHTRDCQWGKQIASYNLVVFQTRAEAERAGYVPCRVCRP
jgi:micrococcal nuclease